MSPFRFLTDLSPRFDAFWRLMRFDKPIGIFLLLWPGLWSLWIAGSGHPGPLVVLVICAGTVLMRAAGCVINDYADRGFDPHVERTRLRPIAAGEVAPKEALALFVVLCLVALCLVLLMNALTIWLAVPGAFLAASYPFMKRFTFWPQAYLGLAFGWAVPMSFAAETGGIPAVAWVIYLATIVWAVIYDTQYAMVDLVDDVRIGVKSTAILFGERIVLIIGSLMIGFLLLMTVAGKLAGLGFWYGAGLGVAAGLFVYQQRLIEHRLRADCFRAFLNNHWVGASLFAGIALDYVLR